MQIEEEAGEVEGVKPPKGGSCVAVRKLSVVVFRLNERLYRPPIVRERSWTCMIRRCMEYVTIT